MNKLKQETGRLYGKLKNVSWSIADCAILAPLTLEINQLKKGKNAIILAHSYQTPDVMYGVADFIGDSYGLSIAATQTSADIIVFCSVHFMAETAKILNPKKTVVVPAAAGCSLAESIMPADVRNLRKKHPKATVVCYVNTSAAVKAECNVCCTSSNALKIVEAMPQNEIIFIPDEYMAKNLQPLTKKKIIGWRGRCIVHEHFTPEMAEEVRQRYPGVKILAHTECSPGIIAKVNFAGGTEGMMNYIRQSNATQFMLITECGLTDRIKSEMPSKHIVGTCALCPYMKQIQMKDVLTALKNPKPDQIVNIAPTVMRGARLALDRMIEIIKN